MGQLEKAWETQRQTNPDNWADFFSVYNIKRYCCKRVLMAHVPDHNQEVVHNLPNSIQISPESENVIRFYLAR